MKRILSMFLVLVLLGSCLGVAAAADGYTGLKKDSTGKYAYYENGSHNTTKYGYVDFGGGKFLVAQGYVATAKSGLAQDPDHHEDWYFLADGQAQLQYTGLAQYDGAWFYISSGKLDTTLAAVVDYDGGKFLVAAGRILREVDGLSRDPVTGTWYYFANGQAQLQYTGLAQYDGAWFLVVEGVLADYYTGTVPYNGAVFMVHNGKVEGQIDVSHMSDSEKDAAARTIAQGIASMIEPGTDLERAAQAAYYVKLYCDQATYTMEGRDYRTAFGVFVKGEYSCAGSTRALGLVLDYLGIKWSHVNENQYTHQWCQIWADGQVGWADGMIGMAGYGTHPYAG